MHDGPRAPAIEVVGLEKRYGSLRAADGISFEVERGEVFGLLGPNGAGKTTTVEILEGYRLADAGHVRVLGCDPARDGSRLRSRMGVMLQDGGLYPGLRPLEILRLFAAFYEEPDDPERLLDALGLREVAGSPVRRLSGGERQGLSLALALIGRPEVVFLDEPTAGMDPHARATTWHLVDGLRERGTTVLLTTHGMDEAEQLCDHLAIVDRGRLVARGTPVELTSDGLEDEVRFSALPALDRADLAVALGVPLSSLTEERAGEYRMSVKATPDLVADLATWLRDRGITLSELRTGRRTLEEVFIRLTAEGPSTQEEGA
jgi:ABC-2 type transport system ATP-binding protein